MQQKQEHETPPNVGINTNTKQSAATAGINTD